MEGERDIFGRADVLVIESDDKDWLYAVCTRCDDTIRMPATCARTFADRIIDHQWGRHHRAWLAIRFAGVDATFTA